MRRLPTPRIERMRVTSREGLPNTAVYRLRPTYWKTRSDSQKQATTQRNRLLHAVYYWQPERGRRRWIPAIALFELLRKGMKINSTVQTHLVETRALRVTGPPLATYRS